MSSSFLDTATRGLIGTVFATLVIALPAGPANAADTYVQPSFELRLESSSNRSLDPVTDSDSDSIGTILDGSALIGIATPKGETTIRPLIKFQDYSDRKEVQQFEGFLDIRSAYSTPRTKFDLVAGYSYRDTYTAELADAAFDELNPDDPTTPETGSNVIGKTRQRFDFRPSYRYKLSERMSIGGELLYQGTRYSGEPSSELVDYDFAEASASLAWQVSPRRNIEIGGFASKYEATDLADQTEAYGATVTFKQQWSEMTGTIVEVLYEQDDIVSSVAPFNQDSSGIGATLISYWKGEVGEWRMAAGRTFTPTGRGGKSTADQIRVQYNRQLSERLKFKGAARYVRDEALDAANSGGDHDIGRMELAVHWLASPTWLIGTGYTYTYKERGSDPEAADDNMFFLAFLYVGRGRQD